MWKVVIYLLSRERISGGDYGKIVTRIHVWLRTNYFLKALQNGSLRWLHVILHKKCYSFCEYFKEADIFARLLRFVRWKWSVGLWIGELNINRSFLHSLQFALKIAFDCVILVSRVTKKYCTYQLRMVLHQYDLQLVCCGFKWVYLWALIVHKAPIYELNSGSAPHVVQLLSSVCTVYYRQWAWTPFWI